jgi:hypothetical protein
MSSRHAPNPRPPKWKLALSNAFTHSRPDIRGKLLKPQPALRQSSPQEPEDYLPSLQPHNVLNLRISHIWSRTNESGIRYRLATAY